MNNRELPFLGAIAGMLRWLEELAVIASGPLLTGGLAIALVDLLTDGKLLASQPALLYAWAISQSIGVDAQLVGSAAKASAAIRARRPWAVLGYVVLVAVLAYVAYVASLVFATQEADGITTAAALSRLGMDSTSWLWQRSGLAVLLVVLSGFLRYVPPAAEASAVDERAKLERELELEPLRVALRARKAAGVREVASALRGRASAPTVSGADTLRDTIPNDVPAAPTQAPAAAEASVRDTFPDTPPKPPTGGGSPASAPPMRTRRTKAAPVLRLEPPRERRKTAAQARASRAHTSPVRTGRRAPDSAERAVRAVWRPDMSVTQLERAAGVSRSTAHKWRKVLLAEAETRAVQ